jgi:hypothetical protein
VGDGPAAGAGAAGETVPGAGADGATTGAAGPAGLEGEACLSVQVSRPSLLKLIPPKVLEATGSSVLAGILLGIRNRVGQQLVDDFRSWCASA